MQEQVLLEVALTRILAEDEVVDLREVLGLAAGPIGEIPVALPDLLGDPLAAAEITKPEPISYTYEESTMTC